MTEDSDGDQRVLQWLLHLNAQGRGGAIRRKKVSQAEPRIRELAACERWNEVVDLFERAEESILVGDATEAAILLDFKLRVCIFCPRHDFTGDSIQARIIEHLGVGARRALRDEEAVRLRFGFERACDRSFGAGWKSDLDNLQGRYLIFQTGLLAGPPELLDHAGKTLISAYMKGDFGLFEDITKRLKNCAHAAPGDIPERSSDQSSVNMNENSDLVDETLEKFKNAAHENRYESRIESSERNSTCRDLGSEICRHWTNPDMPFWLMQDGALKQAIRWVNGGRHIEGRALQQRIRRLGLHRYKRRAIRTITVRKDTDQKTMRFESFGFASFIAYRMQNVPVRVSWGNTHRWLICRLPGRL